MVFSSHKKHLKLVHESIDYFVHSDISRFLVCFMSAVIDRKLRKDYVVPIDRDVCEELGIKPGDRLKVTIEKFKHVPPKNPLY